MNRHHILSAAFASSIALMGAQAQALTTVTAGFTGTFTLIPTRTFAKPGDLAFGNYTSFGNATGQQSAASIKCMRGLPYTITPPTNTGIGLTQNFTIKGEPGIAIRNPRIFGCGRLQLQPQPDHLSLVPTGVASGSTNGFSKDSPNRFPSKGSVFFVSYNYHELADATGVEAVEAERP